MIIRRCMDKVGSQRTIRIIKGLRRSRMIYFLSRKGERDSSSEGLGNL